MKEQLKRVKPILTSRLFFRITLIFFIFESVWIALSAVYPQAFDENFHFGIIQIYSHYWLPFLKHQPTGADAYGAVLRDPSYFFQYLMSFPYRIIAFFVHGQMGQVILLRLIDVGFFAMGIVLFRRVLLYAKTSLALTNLCMLLFVLIPIVPQLAAHINYDDMLFPLVGWACLLTFQWIDEIRARKPSIRTLLTLATVCIFASIVKYAFLPIFVGIILFTAIIVFQTYRKEVSGLFKSLWQSWRVLALYIKAALITLFVIGVGLFAQRDLYNLYRYHAITPDCQAVLTIKQCHQYGPWARNYDTHQDVLKKKAEGKIKYDNPIKYLGLWSYWMWFRSFFAVSGPASNYANYPPLPLPAATAALIGLSGISAVFVWRRQILHSNPYILFFFLASGVYIVSLLIDGYAQYRYTDELVTMNGRYLLPVLLFMCAIIGRAFSLALRKKPAYWKAAIAVIVVLLFLQGGGFLTFLTRSDASWDWDNPVVVKVNNAARAATKPVLFKGSRYYPGKEWVFN
ncbi:MAG TPA: hypothetical protein VGS28_01035 [Candidatus Saccharimonadales bacterium]|nr:hypothetical protein [Candidatus Saccharimonadales bacterium]